MAKGVKHFLKNGTAHNGSMHKMPNGLCIVVKHIVQVVNQ